MSGVYIKGMEMPRDAFDCRFADEYLECEVNGERCAVIETGKGCPLIPVPDHGRLVDENDILNALEPVHREEKAAIAWKHIYANEKYLLSKVPTIIPADRKE